MPSLELDLSHRLLLMGLVPFASDFPPSLKLAILDLPLGGRRHVTVITSVCAQAFCATNGVFSRSTCLPRDPPLRVIASCDVGIPAGVTPGLLSKGSVVAERAAGRCHVVSASSTGSALHAGVRALLMGKRAIKIISVAQHTYPAQFFSGNWCCFF